MRAEIVGFETLPQGVLTGIGEILAVHGANIRIVDEAGIAASGLVLATKQDMISFNDNLPEEKQKPKTLVGRSWETPHYYWEAYTRILKNGFTRYENPEYQSPYELRVKREGDTVSGFIHLFHDSSNMRVRVLVDCLNDGMTDKFSQLGPKTDEFLRAFADHKLAPVA